MSESKTTNDSVPTPDDESMSSHVDLDPRFKTGEQPLLDDYPPTAIYNGIPAQRLYYEFWCPDRAKCDGVGVAVTPVRQTSQLWCVKCKKAGRGPRLLKLEVPFLKNTDGSAWAPGNGKTLAARPRVMSIAEQMDPGQLYSKETLEHILDDLSHPNRSEWE